MTPAQLRALLNQCTTLPDGRIEIDRSDMAEIARDALRFSHLSKFTSANLWRNAIRIEWQGVGLDARKAIDADMGEAP